MNSFKRQSCHGYREMDEWMTSERRWGEGVWNWFGGGARGGVCHWIILCRCGTLSCVPRCLRCTGSPGKALIYLFPLSQKRWPTLKVTVCVCMCVCILLWSLSSGFGHMGVFDSQVGGVKTAAAWSSTWTVWCLVLEECLFLHNFSIKFKLIFRM